jgi:hypothetical protein
VGRVGRIGLRLLPGGFRVWGAIWADVLAPPFAAGLVRPPDVDDLDRQVAGRAEHLFGHRGPVQQA